MARKLNAEEQRQFLAGLQNPDATELDLADEESWTRLGRKRDKTFSLTSELEEWFGKEFPFESYF